MNHGKTTANQNLLSIHTTVEIEELIDNYEITQLQLRILYSIANDISSERHHNKALGALNQVIPTDSFASKHNNQPDIIISNLSYSDFLIWKNWLLRAKTPRSLTSIPREFDSFDSSYQNFAQFFISIAYEVPTIINADLSKNEKQGLLDIFLTYNLSMIKTFRDEQTKAGALKLLAENLNLIKESSFSITKTAQEYLEIANTIQGSNLKQAVISALKN